MLAGQSVFAQLDGSVDSSGVADEREFQISPSDFALSGDGVLIGFRVRAQDDSSLDPAAASLHNQSGGLVSPLVSSHNVLGTDDSLLVADLGLGSYTLRVAGEDGTTGAYSVQVFLVGDVDGSRNVDAADTDQLMNQVRFRIHSAEADINHDGIVTFFDQLLATRNVGDATSIQPLDVVIDPHSELHPIGDSGFATNVAALQLAGSTQPGITVELDSDGDGQFDDGTTVAGPTGSFSFDVQLGEGLNSLAFRASDSFGQVAETTIDITLDTTPPPAPTAELDPSFDSAPTGDLQTTFTEVTLIGQTEPGALVTVVETGNSTTADSTGTYSIAGVSLVSGENALTVRATDAAGNDASTLVTLTRLAESGALVSLAEGQNFVVQQTLLAELGQAEGRRSLTFALDAQFDTTDQSTATGDLFLIYLVDPADPSQTLLGRGEPGSALFTLSERGPEFAAGLVFFDGTNVEIDVSSLGELAQGQLVLQVINGDDDTGTRIDVFSISNQVDPEGTSGVAFPFTADVRPVGGAINTSTMAVNESLTVLVSNVRYDASTGMYAGELAVRNDGPSMGRNLVVTFPGLPAGVTLANASGSTAAGVPYLNLRPIIPFGGLPAGHTTPTVELLFDNPQHIRFALRPEVLSGGPNQPPTLAPIDPVTVMPGRHVEILPSASDPDGDLLTYRLISSAPLPAGEFDPSGRIVFRPTPNQIGSYVFELQVTDGALTASRMVQLDVVADPITTTRISGVIQDVDRNPLVGVPIELGSLHTTTDSNGAFELEFAAGLPDGDTLFVRADELTGLRVFPFIAEKLPLLFGRDVIEGVNNVIPRPIFLPALDVENGMVVDPLQDMTITTPKIPGAAVHIAAGSLEDQQGQPFNGVLSITEVPRELTPAALPNDVLPDVVVTIQPGEMVFTTPAPLTLPNRAGYAPGTVMDLFSINPVTGDFDIVGTMVVSADGSVMETTEGGIRNSSWHFGTPQQPTPPEPPETDPINPDEACPDCLTSSAEATSRVELHSGAVIETHDLVTYQSAGEHRGVTLVYDSLRADPREIVNFAYNNPRQPGLFLTANLRVELGDFTYRVPGFGSADVFTAAQQIGGVFYDMPNGNHLWRVDQSAATVQGGLQVDLAGQATGVYEYVLNSGFARPSPLFSGSGSTSFVVNSLSGRTRDFRDRLVHIDERDSPFGSGWGVAGMQWLVDNTFDGSILLVDGDGSEIIFSTPDGGDPGGPLTFVSSGEDHSLFERLADGTFRRTLTDQTVYQFNADNRLSTVADRNGNTTTYQYDGLGRLEKIIDPVGLETLFTYDPSTGRIESIADPAGRTTAFEHDAAGNLMQVTDPDAASRTWIYDELHHMTGETDKLGYSESMVYDFAGRAESAVRKDGTELFFQPVQTRALYEPDRTTPVREVVDIQFIPFSQPIERTFQVLDPFDAPFARARDGAQAEVADANGNVILLELNGAGQVVSQFDSLGGLPGAERNETNLIVQTTDGRGNVTNFTYDDRGNVLSVEDAVSRQLELTGANFPDRLSELNRFTSQPIGADVDQDGHLDLISNIFSAIVVSLGDGKGNFHEHFTFDFGIPSASVRGVALGDVTGDQILDIVVGSTEGTNNATGPGSFVGVLVGNGDGTFSAGFSISNNEGPATVELGDLNGDGILDIVSGNNRSRFQSGNAISHTQSVSIYFGNDDGTGVADGTFTFQQTLEINGPATDVAFVDLNRDNKLDIVASAQRRSVGNDTTFAVTAILNDPTSANGPGMFDLADRTDYATTDPTGQVLVGDLNGDDIPDFVFPLIGNDEETKVPVMLGDGAGGLGPEMLVDLGVVPLFGMHLVDFQADGSADLVFATAEGDRILTWRGDGAGGFVPFAELPTPNAVSDIALADINGDLTDDLIALFHPADSGGDFQAKKLLSSLPGNGDGTFGPWAMNVAVGGRANGVAVGDVNGDTILDLVSGNEDGSVSIALGDGSGQFGPTTTVPIGGITRDVDSVVLGDIDGDGDLDIAGTIGEFYSYDETDKEEVFILFNNNGLFDQPPDLLEVGRGAIDLVLGDVDGSGDNTPPDLIVATKGRTEDANGVEYGTRFGEIVESVSILINDGAGSFGPKQVLPVVGARRAVVYGDVNDDGDMDIVTAGYEDRGGPGHVTILLGDGQGGFSALPELPVGAAPWDIALGDVDNDGIVDIVTVDFGNVFNSAINETVSILLGTGSGNFAEAVSFAIPAEARAMALVDIDNDDNLDLLLTDEATASVIILHGQGDASFLPPRRFSVDRVPRAIAIADFNGDTLLDFVTANRGKDRRGSTPADPAETLSPRLNQGIDAPGGGPTPIGERRYTYDPVFNQITSVTDELGRLTLFDIDPANGNVLSQTRVVGELGGSDDEVQSFTYTSSGLLETYTNPRGFVTRYDYDSLDRLMSVTFAEGTAAEAVRSFEYADLSGNLTAYVDENNDRAEFIHNVMNLRTEIIQPDLSAYLRTFDANGNLTSFTDPTGITTTYQYDVLGRLTTDADENGAFATRTYDANGNVAQLVDRLGRVSSFVYDARNRLIRTVDPEGNVTRTSYDSDNNLIAVTDPLGNATRMVYDARNRLIRELDPIGNTTSYDYDASNNLIRSTDRNGRVTELVYDELDRLTSEIWVGDTNVFHYQYDANGNLTNASDAFSSVTLTYDERDRMLAVDNAGTPNAPHVVLTYTYDAIGNVLSVNDEINGASAGQTAYMYDNRGRLSRITQQGFGVSEKRVDLVHNSGGKLTQVSRFADVAGTQSVVASSWAYDDLGRLTDIDHSGSSGLVAFYDLVYDADGQITSISDVDGTSGYAMDDVGQLTAATHSNPEQAEESYGYDGAGNRLDSHLHGAAYVTDAANRLVDDGQFTYQYDAEGKLILRTDQATGAVREFQWDYRNRLTMVTDRDSAGGVETQTAEYTYDAAGRRISKAVDTNPTDLVDAAITSFIYDREDIILEFLDGVQQTRYLHGAAVDQVFAQEDAGGNVLWHLTDHLGTARDLADNSGNVVKHVVFDSFGNVVSDSNSSITTLYAFTGREFDAETGLYYYRARFYDAAVGRFISEDPSRFSAGDANLYRYVTNNPVLFVDPAGLERCSFWERVADNYTTTFDVLGSPFIGALEGVPGPTSASGVIQTGVGAGVAGALGTQTAVGAVGAVGSAVVGSGTAGAAAAAAGSAAVTVGVAALVTTVGLSIGVGIGSVINVGLNELMAGIYNTLGLDEIAARFACEPNPNCP